VKSWFEMNRSGRNASRWFTRLHANDFSDATDRAFRRWLRGNPQNEEELERRELLWELLGELQNDPEVVQLTQSTMTPPRLPEDRNRAWYRAGWAIAAAALLSLGYWTLHIQHRHEATPGQEEVYATSTGEQRQVMLPDGSRISLNTATQLRARFTDTARRITLDWGEAIFFVQHDARRPFEVSAGHTQTRALGTIFNILYLDNRTGISVLEGRVHVAADSGSVDQRQVELFKGLATTYTAKTGLGPVGPADLARISSWQAQRVEFDNVSLLDAVRDFNRYSAIPIRIGDHSIDSLRVSGVFHFDDIKAFTNALHGAFGIRSQRQEQTVVLLPANAHGAEASRVFESH
jgi:transmembrane sensor